MRTRLTVALLVAAASASLIAQATQPQTQGQATFRAAANLVRVDMYATQNGVPIEDLQQDEIELLEDGVPQTLDSFEFVKVAPAGPQDTRREPASVAESRDMAREARARVFVIFLDTYHTQAEGSANMRIPLARFIDRVLGADDLVALMTPEMSINELTFARKTTIISTIVQEEWWGRRERIAGDADPKERLYRACYGPESDTTLEMRDRRREMLTLDALEGLVVHLRGIREERKAVLTVTEGWRLFADNPSLARQSEGTPPTGPPVGVVGGRVGVAPGGNDGTALDRLQCETDRIALAAMNNTRRMQRLSEDANRANVSFYPVFARGLVAFDAPIGPNRPPEPAVDRANLTTRQNAMRELATNTDGTAVINTNQIEAALTRIAADLSSYYLFGYYSTNTRLDGRFREITVRVKRPGVQVRARRGYRGLTAAELTGPSVPPGGASGASASAFTVPVNTRASLRIRTSGWTPNGTVPAAVWIVGELDPALRRELAWSAGATAEVVVVGQSGVEVTSATVDIAATEAAFTVRLPAEANLAPGEYAVRVRVNPNAALGLPVSDTVRLIVPAAGSMLGEAILWRRGPSTGPRFLATADPRFTRNDRVRLELATAVEGAATARMLDRLGRPMQIPVQVSQRPDASGQFRWIVAEAALAPLATGDYAIEVTLADSRQLAAFKIVP